MCIRSIPVCFPLCCPFALGKVRIWVFDSIITLVGRGINCEGKCRQIVQGQTVSRPDTSAHYDTRQFVQPESNSEFPFSLLSVSSPIPAFPSCLTLNAACSEKHSHFNFAQRTLADFRPTYCDHSASWNTQRFRRRAPSQQRFLAVEKLMGLAVPFFLRRESILRFTICNTLNLTFLVLVLVPAARQTPFRRTPPHLGMRHLLIGITTAPTRGARPGLRQTFHLPSCLPRPLSPLLNTLPLNHSLLYLPLPPFELGLPILCLLLPNTP